MKSTKTKLAGYRDIEQRIINGHDFNAVDEIIYHFEPEDDHDSSLFRKLLLAVLALEDEEEVVERNIKVVSDFMEHCKAEGINIPETVFEEFFDV